MEISEMFELLQEVARKAPCNLNELTKQQPPTMRLPVSQDPSKHIGPPPMPHENLDEYQREQERLRKQGYVELRSVPPRLTSEKDQQFRILEDLKLVRVARRPEGGSFASVAPNQRGFVPSVLGLTAKGHEALQLCSKPHRLDEAVELLITANALTFPNLMLELRRLARRDVNAARESKK